MSRQTRGRGEPRRRKKDIFGEMNPDTPVPGCLHFASKQQIAHFSKKNGIEIPPSWTRHEMMAYMAWRASTNERAAEKAINDIGAAVVATGKTSAASFKRVTLTIGDIIDEPTPYPTHLDANVSTPAQPQVADAEKELSKDMAQMSLNAQAQANARKPRERRRPPRAMPLTEQPPAPAAQHQQQEQQHAHAEELPPVEFELAPGEGEEERWFRDGEKRLARKRKPRTNK